MLPAPRRLRSAVLALTSLTLVAAAVPAVSAASGSGNTSAASAPGSAYATVDPVQLHRRLTDAAMHAGVSDDYEPPLPPVREQAAADAPNIVLITTDDQTAADMAYMPQTRRLLGEAGATFTDAISPHPLCCPARAEIVTGQFAQNNGVHSNGGAYGGYRRLKDPHDTLPRWLYSSGYHTGMIGKFITHWKPQRDGVPTGWEWFDVPRTSAFGYYDFKMFTQGRKRRYNDGRAYSTTYTTDRTVDLIRDWSLGRDPAQPDAPVEADPKPFFIWSSYYAPHGECGESSCKQGPVPEAKYADALGDAKAPSLAKRSYDARQHRPNPLVAGKRVASRGHTQSFFLDRVRSLQSVDDGVAEIVETLRQTGELDNTLIIFTSDNGYLLGEHRYSGKIVPYEEALRVPLIVRGPGIEPATLPWTATTVDLASTIASAAGTRPGRRQDGRDLMPALLGGSAPAGDTTLVQAGARSAKEGTGAWMYRGVRTERYTFTKWRTRSGRPFRELLDREVDPQQIRNRAGTPRYRRVQRELERRLGQLDRCAGTSSCFRDFGPAPDPKRR